MSAGRALPRTGGNVIPLRAFRIRLGLGLLALLALADCRWPLHADAPKPIAQRITWCGLPPSRFIDSVPADTSRPEACIRVLSLDFPGSESPFRMEMREYRQPRFAFAAWLSLGAAPRSGLGANRSGEGFFRMGPRWAFVHGTYLGLTDSSAANLYPEEFKERLGMIGEPIFQLPPEFEAFPLIGRIPGSEGLFLRDFLGTTWQGPIFTVAYDCHGDTALAFRGFPQMPDSLSHALSAWKGHFESGKNGQSGGFQGEDPFGYPIILKVFPKGILGFSGCFDSRLSLEHVEKMQKMRFFWHNP
jgi:hypothetical protein